MDIKDKKFVIIVLLLVLSAPVWISVLSVVFMALFVKIMSLL